MGSFGSFGSKPKFGVAYAQAKSNFKSNHDDIINKEHKDHKDHTEKPIYKQNYVPTNYNFKSSYTNTNNFAKNIDPNSEGAKLKPYFL